MWERVRKWKCPKGTTRKFQTISAIFALEKFTLEKFFFHPRQVKVHQKYFCILHRLTFDTVIFFVRSLAWKYSKHVSQKPERMSGRKGKTGRWWWEKFKLTRLWCRRREKKFIISVIESAIQSFHENSMKKKKRMS